MEKTVERARQMIVELVESGLTMTRISDGTNVNPTTLGWIRNGKVSKIKDSTFDKIHGFWSEKPKPEKPSAEKKSPAPPPAVTTGPKLEGTKLEQSFQMVRDLLKKGKSSSDIVRGTGIASQTVSNLRNEKSKKVTNRVYNRLRDFWRQEMNGKVADKPVTPPRVPQGRPETDVTGIISHTHVPVNADAMRDVIDRLIGNFEAAVKELEGIRREIESISSMSHGERL